MEALQYYAKSHDYCSACLNASSEVPLLPNNANEFFSSIVVNVLTPWLCNRCSGILQAYQELRGKAVRAQTLLSDILLNTEMVEAKKEYYINELHQIKSAPKHVRIVVSADVDAHVSESENCKAETHQSGDEIKIEYNNSTAEIKDEKCAVNLSNLESGNLLVERRRTRSAPFKGSPTTTKAKKATRTATKCTRKPLKIQNHPAKRRTSSSPPIECDSPDEAQVGVGLVQTKRATRTATRRDRQPLNIQNRPAKRDSPDEAKIGVGLVQTKGKRASKTNMIRDRKPSILGTETSVFLDEHDDVMSSDIVNSKVKEILITEQEYIKWIKEILQSKEYLNAKYKCDNCAIIWERYPPFAQHMNTKHSGNGGPHRCKLCTQHFSTERNFRAHMRSHAYHYRCVECGLHTNSRRDTADHYFSRHTQIEFRCKYCDFKSRKPLFVAQHIYASHVHQALRVECNVCNKSVIKKHLRKHMEIHSNKLAGELYCALCDKQFKHKNTLKDHMDFYHLGLSGEECSICHKWIMSRSKKSHARTHSQECVTCIVCNQVFVNQITLSSHMNRKHLDIAGKYKCDDCGKGFYTKSELSSHTARIHLKIYSFQCTMCEEKFIAKQPLKEHILRKHHKIQAAKDKICDVCGKGFSASATLKKHHLIHTGEKPHSCGHCGRSFRTRSVLTTHIKLVHMDIKYRDLIASRKKQKKVCFEEK